MSSQTSYSSNTRNKIIIIFFFYQESFQFHHSLHADVRFCARMRTSLQSLKGNFPQITRRPLDSSGDPSHFSLRKNETRIIPIPRWKVRVNFFSRPVPYAPQIDLPCYVSAQKTGKSALTSAFGLSQQTILMHCFNLTIRTQRLFQLTCMHSCINGIWGTFISFLSC